MPTDQKTISHIGYNGATQSNEEHQSGGIYGVEESVHYLPSEYKRFGYESYKWPSSHKKIEKKTYSK